MKVSPLFFQNAEERFLTLRPLHYQYLLDTLHSMPHWNEAVFYNALDNAGWKEKRVPLRIMNAERVDWEKSLGELPYGKVSYAWFSEEWKQSWLHKFFSHKGRFIYVFKKGIGLINAYYNLNQALRTLYTDLPLLYDMEKIGVGVILLSQDEIPSLEKALKEKTPPLKMPLIIFGLSD